MKNSKGIFYFSTLSIGVIAISTIKNGYFLTSYQINLIL